MKRTRWWAGAAITTLTLAPGLMAQRAPRARPPGSGLSQGSVEEVMRLRERLGLTDAQMQSLDQIRRELVEQRAARQARVAELRSRALAGEAEPSEVREALRQGREAMSAQRGGDRERVLGVLDQAQRDSLNQMSERARAFRMGRRSAFGDRGRAAPGGRGRAAPGARGRRWGPSGGVQRPGIRSRGSLSRWTRWSPPSRGSGACCC